MRYQVSTVSAALVLVLAGCGGTDDPFAGLASLTPGPTAPAGSGSPADNAVPPNSMPPNSMPPDTVPPSAGPPSAGPPSAGPGQRPPLVSRTPSPKPARPVASTDGPCRYAESEQLLADPNTFDVGLPPDPDPTPTTGPATATLGTNLGVIELRLDRALAPCTVQSFVHLARSGFYNATACPRSVDEGIFVVQCGDPTASGSGGPTYRYGDEGLAQADYRAGAVAMANSGPDTNGGQFFIVFQDSNSSLSKAYTHFATVTGGLDIVERIGRSGNDATNAAGGGRPNIDLTVVTVAVGS